MNNQSGIYEILNTVNGKQYIGSAVNFRKRWEDPEMRAKIVASMSEAKRGTPAAIEACAKMSAMNKGKPRSPKDKAAISAATRGKKKKPLSPEHKAALSVLMTAAHASKRAAGQPWRKQVQ